MSAPAKPGTPVAPHIWLDERGAAWIDDTGYKVMEVAADRVTHGWSAEEICWQHYRHMSMAQIHAALTYYYDHQAEFDAEMERLLKEYEQLRAQNLDTPGRQKLRAMGLIP
jgi:uncharacterized protein (DUF433 family)